jgi:hypothetical protein
MPSLKRALPPPVLLALCWLKLAASVQGLLEGLSNECQRALYTLGKQHYTERVQALNADHMLYFLHIPRTAGRTYGACFLKQAWAPSRRCAKSYDVLRLNSSVPDCGLLSSHDDYSVIQYLPRDAAVATQLRDPVDRVLSTYEFAVEVAARALVKDAPDKDPSKIDTQNVWPWSLLVPFIRQDLMRKVRSCTFDTVPALTCRDGLRYYLTCRVMAAGRRHTSLRSSRSASYSLKAIHMLLLHLLLMCSMNDNTCKRFQ